MDYKTAKKIRDISREVFDKNKEAFLPKKISNEHLRDMARHLIKKGGPNAEKIKQGFKIGAYDDIPNTSIDPRVEAKMEREIEGRIEAEIRSGRMPPAQRDEFIKELEWNRRKK